MKVVFAHRTGGEKKLSSSIKGEETRPRSWAEITSNHDPVLVAFRRIVGRKTWSCKHSNNLISRRKY